MLHLLYSLLIVCILSADDGINYTPPSPDMNLNCAVPAEHIRSVTLSELYNGGGNEYFEMVEIYFNETTTISGWRLYFNDNNTHKYINLGTGMGDVYYPDGTVGTDNAATYPKGTMIVYEIDNIDPTNGEVFIANTTTPLSSNASVVVDYFNYYKTSPLNYYVIPSACSVTLPDVDPNAQTFARYDVDGNFTQYYPGTNEEITPSPGGDNSENLPPETTLVASAYIDAFFDRSEAYTGEIVTLTLRITNPASAQISVNDINVSNLIPSGLSYIADDGGTLLDPLMPSTPYGTVVSTTPQFLWRFINGTALLSLPIGSIAEIKAQLQVTAAGGTIITDTAILSTKQTNIGTSSSSDTLHILTYPLPTGQFDAWDIFRSVNDRNISTKIVGKPFNLTVASLNHEHTAFTDFNGTVCAAITTSTGERISDWNTLYFSSAQIATAPFTLNRAIGGNDYARVTFHSQWGVHEPCPLMNEVNATFSSDDFSIRPSSFALSSSNAVAGNDFNITFNALNFSSTPSDDYNESAGMSFEVIYAEHNSSCITGSFSPAVDHGWEFSNGSKIFTTRYNEVGIVDIRLTDVAKSCSERFTAIDCDDANVSDGTDFTADLLPIGTIQGTIRIVPHHFDLNATLSNFEKGAFTYLSNDLNMSAQFDLNITAKNAQGDLTQNYDQACYAQNTHLNLSHTSVPPPLSIILYAEQLSGIEGNITKNAPLSLSLERSIFTQGSAPLSFSLNFDRNRAVAQNPFDFSITDTNLTDSDNTRGETLSSGNATFIYGRARGYDISTDLSTVPVPIEMEIYSTISNGYVSQMPQNVYQWYRNLHHNSTTQGSILEGEDYTSTTKSGLSSTITIDTATPPSHGLHLIRINNSDAISHAIIHLNIPSWLWYSTNNEYSFDSETKCIHHPCFDYRFFGTETSKGVSSGTFGGSDFPLTPAKKIIQKGVKLFR